MKKYHPFVWELYSTIFLIYIAQKIHFLFSPEEPVLLYYQLLCGFTGPFCAAYMMEVIHLVLSVAYGAILYGYTYRIPILSQKIWQYLFIIYALVDITGHSYERHYLISLWHADPRICLIVSISFIAPYIPAYIAGWQYSFTKKIFH